MDLNAKQFGEAERARHVKIRDEAQVIIDYWNKQLGDGGPAPIVGDGGGHEQPAFPGASGTPSDYVAEAELIGNSAPKATRLIMQRMEKQTGMRRPLRVPDIWAALKKGGIEQKKDQLYTTLPRSPMFHSPQKGLWGLTEWYPNAKKAEKGGAEDDVELESDGTGDESESDALRIVEDAPDVA